MEYFPEFLKSKKNIFIEKPFFNRSKKFNTLLNKKIKKILIINIYLLTEDFMML